MTLTELELELVHAAPSKLAMLLVVTQELARSQAERAVGLIEKAMTRTLVRGENTVLLSSDARVQGVTPGGLLYGWSPISGSPVVGADDIQARYTPRLPTRRPIAGGRQT